MKYLSLGFLLIILLATPLARSTPFQAASDVSLPLCSSVIHGKYKAVGPDGAFYPTWHPQVDAVANCYFDHEHGSSPGLLAPVTKNTNGIVPLYGYTAAKHGMDEPHPGFKTYVFADGTGHRWMVTQHFGTANAMGRACVSMHTVDMVGIDATTLEEVADLHFMGDFGKSIEIISAEPLTPDACPNQAQDATGSFGLRIMPTASGPWSVDEFWRLDRRPLAAIGFASGDLTFKTLEPQTICDTRACAANVTGHVPSNATGSPPRGSWRYLFLANGFSIAPVTTGTFYTDPMGQQPRAAEDADAVAQYIKPGFSYDLAPPSGTNCWPDVSGMHWCRGVSLQNDESFRRNPFVTGAN